MSKPKKSEIPQKNSEIVVNASELRCVNGYYQWWANEKCLDVIINQLKTII